MALRDCEKQRSSLESKPTEHTNSLSFISTQAYATSAIFPTRKSKANELGVPGFFLLKTILLVSDTKGLNPIVFLKGSGSLKLKRNTKEMEHPD